MPNELDETILRNFVRNTIDDYNENILVDKYVKNSPQTEGEVGLNQFVQIGIEPVVDKAIFDPNGNYYPIIFGLTKSIALEERNYFFNKIFDDVNITTYDLSKDDFKYPSLLGRIGDLSANIFLSIDLERKMVTNKNWLKFITFKGKNPVLFGGYGIFSVPDESLQDKIIIIDSNYNKWLYIKFYNNIINSDERLDFGISEIRDNQVKLILRTLNLFYLSSDFIKIINLIE